MQHVGLFVQKKTWNITPRIIRSHEMLCKLPDLGLGNCSDASSGEREAPVKCKYLLKVHPVSQAHKVYTHHPGGAKMFNENLILN